jgi:pyruvate/2-oxoglutarate dehydrogenase complex dihydrolipoamide acyltransferase (E2) component
MTAGFASAAARDLAASSGVSPDAIPGSGRGGLVTVADVRAARPAVPENLGATGTARYLAIRKDWELRPDEEAILAAACRMEDELSAMERELASASPVVPGSKGQARAHPLIMQVREHRLAMRLLFASLGLDEADAETGRDALARSTAGRKLALIRHGGRRG